MRRFFFFLRVLNVRKNATRTPTKTQGLHNWIQMYNEEKRGKLDYMGYIFPRKRGYEDTPAEDEQLITVQVRREMAAHVK